MRKPTLIFAGLLVLATVWLWPVSPVRHAAGVVTASGDPVQTAPPATPPWKKGTYTITPLAGFHIKAVVLSKAHYLMDREAELAPYDLAMGWGPMSDQAVIDTLDISQSGRWYFFQFTNRPCPIGKREVETHSANMHMVPASDRVAAALASVRQGQAVKIDGDLIRIDAPDGWHWQSSLSREDTGDGSCEVVWVESVTSGEK